MQFPRDKKCQKHCKETHQHVHADHQHGAETNLAEPIQQNHAGRDPFGPEKLQPQRIEKNKGGKIDDQVRNQADPLGKVPFCQRRTEVQNPVIQGRVYISHLIIVHGSCIKTRFSFGDCEIVKKIITRQGLLFDAVGSAVADKGHITAVGETVSVNLIDEQSALPQAEMETDG